MGRLSGYRDPRLGGGGAQASWLESWKKKEKKIKVWLHREAPWERDLHSFRKVITDESGSEPVKKIAWLPFVCWEGRKYHGARYAWKKGYEGAQEVHAEACPMCRLVEYFDSRHDLEADSVIFQFRTGKDVRDILLVDFIGEGKRKRSFEDDGTAKHEFIIGVIPADNPSAVLLTNEKYSLGKKLLKRIETDCKELGEERGDPSQLPICYLWQLQDDQKPSYYDVTRFPEEKLTEQVKKLWDGPCPDADPWVRPSNPNTLLEAAKAAAQLDIPWDDIFGPALARWNTEESDDVGDFPPPDDDEEEEAPKAEKPKAEKPKAEKPKAEKPKAETKEEPKRRTTRKTKPKEEPKPEPEVESLPCEECGGDWPVNVNVCPHCGAEADDDIPFA